MAIKPGKHEGFAFPEMLNFIFGATPEIGAKPL